MKLLWARIRAWFHSGAESPAGPMHIVIETTDEANTVTSLFCICGAVFYTVDSGRQTPRQKEPGND